MPQAATSAISLGQQFRESPGVRQAIDAILKELKARQAGITDVRAPINPEAKSTFDETLKDFGRVRGRDILYPYMGSGIGNGPFVEMIDGSVKMDLITGIGVHFFGHSDPGMVAAALESSLSDVVNQGHLMQNEEPLRFSKLLLEQAQRASRLSHVILCNSGVMANENAIKICYQKHAPASRVICFAHSFMGRTVTMSQIGDSAANRQGIPLSTLVDYMPFYDPAAARRMSAGDQSGQTRFIDMCVWHLRQYIERYPKQHACFIFELVQGEGGFNTAPPEFFRELMNVCRAEGLAVWDDEVQTWGRTEQMFCYEAMGLGDLVDVVCVGKMSQVCAILFTPEYNPKPGLVSQTFLGSSDTLRVGREVLERLTSGGYYGKDGKIARHHAVFREGIRALAAKHPDWFPAGHDYVDIVGGFGGMMRFTPFGGQKDPVLKLCKALYDEGLIVFYCGHGPYHVRMLPPLGVMQESHWPRAFQLIEAGMARLAPTLNRKPAAKS